MLLNIRGIDADFEEVYKAYSKSIFNFCMSRLSYNEDYSADCTQQTFLVYYEKLKSGMNIENSRAYLYRIAENYILKKYSLNGVIHCFSGSLEIAKEYIKMGYYIGIGGVVTFKNAKKLIEVAENISLDKIVLETDCPYLSPEPNRGKRNDSTNLHYVVKKISELKGISEEEIIKQTYKNAIDLYKLN